MTRIFISTEPTPHEQPVGLQIIDRGRQCLLSAPKLTAARFRLWLTDTGQSLLILPAPSTQAVVLRRQHSSPTTFGHDSSRVPTAWPQSLARPRRHVHQRPHLHRFPHARRPYADATPSLPKTSNRRGRRHRFRSTTGLTYIGSRRTKTARATAFETKNGLAILVSSSYARAFNLAEGCMKPITAIVQLL